MMEIQGELNQIAHKLGVEIVAHQSESISETV
jgi:hypothetical protein